MNKHHTNSLIHSNNATPHTNIFFEGRRQLTRTWEEQAELHRDRNPSSIKAMVRITYDKELNWKEFGLFNVAWTDRWTALSVDHVPMMHLNASEVL